MTGTTSAKLAQIYKLWGHGVVLLPVAPGTKKCYEPNWQLTDWAKTQAQSYQKKLQQSSIAVLFGPANLAGLDCDNDRGVERFLELNPWAANTLRTRGARGATFHFKLRGDYPRSLHKYKVNGQGDGEWRGAGGYTVVSGTHPDTGKPYQILVANPALEIDWSQIKWPPEWDLPWTKEPPRNESAAPSPTVTGDLDKRIRAYLDTIPPGVQGRHGSDPMLKAATALVIGFNLGIDGARPYLELYGSKCDPPWTNRKEVEHKLAEAAKNKRHKPIGWLLEALPTPTKEPKPRKEPGPTVWDPGVDTQPVGSPNRQQDPGPEQRSNEDPTGRFDQSKRQSNRREDEGVKVPEKDARELELANILIAQIPPLKCVGEDWYVYANGLWRQTSKDEFKPQALAIQHPEARTARKATEVLRHVEFSAQADEKQFKSCYRKTAEGLILINCANGVLEVTADGVSLRPHSPGDLFTRQLAASYHQEARAPLFEQIAGQNLPDQLDVRLFNCFCGYILLPDCRHEASLICYGKTGTGKSTLAHGISAVLGPELVTHLSLAQISAPENKNLAKLARAALNLSTELDAVEVGSENFKLLCSGEGIDADRKYRDSILLETPCKFWFNANHLPRFRKGTDAELRRLHFLHFAHLPPTADETLKERIQAERDGILAIMVGGLQNLLKTRKFSTGGQNSGRTRERFKIENDPVNCFIAARTLPDPAEQTSKTDLFEAYRTFCQQNAVPVSEEDSWFFRLLYDQYHLKEARPWINGVRVRVIKGIILVDHVSQDDQDV